MPDGSDVRHGRWTLLALGALAALTACNSPVGVPIGTGANPGEIQYTALVQEPPEAALVRADAILSDLGFERSTEDPSRYETTFLERGRNWAFCEVFTYREGRNEGNRYRSLRVRSGDAAVGVFATAVPEGTRVQIWPDFIGTYRRPDGTGTFDRPCSSFGIVEQAFFERFGGAPG